MEKFNSLIKVKENVFNGDFNGPKSSLSTSEQISYLEEYFKIAKKEFNFNENKKNISEEEISEVLNNIHNEKFEFRNRKYIKNINYKIFKNNAYKYINLFAGAQVKDNSIILKEVETTPLPSFEIEIQNQFDYFSGDIFLDKKFFSPIRGRIDTMYPSRNIEFKNLKNEILKLSLFSNGELYVNIFEKDKYHPVRKLVGKALFDTDNSFSVKFIDNKIIISLNNDSITVENKSSVLPNQVFFGSGLHARFYWKISNLVIQNKDLSYDLFENNEVFDDSISHDSTLPFRFGGLENRGLSALISFEYCNENMKKKLIHISEFGPSISLYINNKFVSEASNYIPLDLDIRPFLKDGKNEIKILLNPTAPENVAFWHRHDDKYFASYIGEVYIDEVNSNYIKSVKIETLDTSNSTIKAKIDSFVTSKEKDVKIDVFDMSKNLINSVFDSDILIFNGISWDYNNPKLYLLKIKLFDQNTLIDEFEIITGFRTIKQVDGSIYLNDKKTFLKGALSMQYLAPYDEVVLNHNMPSDEQIISQLLQIKKMNGNSLRMHQLGYGSNDARFARYADYLGITLIWITRCIDSSYGIIFDKTWHSKRYYQEQMKEVINYPSVIMWEGSNEFFLYKDDINAIYKEFVNGILEIDNTRLISPVSHLYYGNDSYDKGCNYFQDDGKHDEFFNECNVCEQWNNPLVVRSAHTYQLLLGYGSTWEELRKQSWSAQKALLNSKKHSYLVSEYAIIGRQNPNIEEAKTYFSNDSYEYDNETVLNYYFDDKTWHLSQSYQALAASFATRKMIKEHVDGLYWCCLNGGANNATYLKALIDFYGYPKLAYNVLKSEFELSTLLLNDTDIAFNNNQDIHPTLLVNPDNKKHDVEIIFKDLNDEVVKNILYKDILFSSKVINLNKSNINLNNNLYKVYLKIE